MAYFTEDFKEEDEKKKIKEQQDQQIAPGLSPGVTGKRPAPKAPTESGAFTNLQSYLSKNIPQSEKMARKVVEKTLLTPEKELQKSINEAETGFREKVETSGMNLDPSKEEITSILSDPTSENVKQFTPFRDVEYEGPKQFEGSGFAAEVKDDIDKLNYKADSSNTESGRFSLLKDAFNTAGYNHGEQSLDQLLLQNQPKSREIFNEARDVVSPITEQYSLTREELDKIAADKAIETQAVQDFARESVDQSILNEEEAIKAVNTQAIEDQNLYYEKLRNALKLGDLTSEQLIDLGLTEGQSFYGVDPESYIQPSSIDPSYLQTTSMEDKAKYDALLNMAGKTDQGIINEGATYFNPNEVSGAQAFRDRVGVAQETYEDKISSAEKNEKFWSGQKGKVPRNVQKIIYGRKFGIKVPVASVPVANPEWVSRNNQEKKFRKIKEELIKGKEEFTIA